MCQNCDLERLSDLLLSPSSSEMLFRSSKYTLLLWLCTWQLMCAGSTHASALLSFIHPGVLVFDKTALIPVSSCAGDGCISQCAWHPDLFWGGGRRLLLQVPSKRTTFWLHTMLQGKALRTASVLLFHEHFLSIVATVCATSCVLTLSLSDAGSSF